jgi:pimeloyl-ACP methyl ester carboxylesterase
VTTEPAGARRPRFVISRDGTPIAVFTGGEGPPLILVHGTTADHTTFRASGPVLAQAFATHAVDRRGRGASGDGSGPYRIELEYEDLAAVAEAIAEEAGEPVDIVGHSYGGRCALGAGLLTDAIGRLVVYEGAPSPGGREGYRPAGVEQRIARLVESADHDAALATFFREVVRMSEPDLAAYRADPIWPVRAAAVHTTVREMAGEGSTAASLEALGRVEQPVLQILGGDSPAVFGEATRALDARLADGRIAVIDGARHAAHHTHVEPFVAATRAFLGRPPVAD